MSRVEQPLGIDMTGALGAEPSLRGDFGRMPWVSFAIIVAMVLVAVGAPLIASYSPTEQSLPDKLKPPAWQEGGSRAHLLGTDILGRDVLSRLAYGARVSLS